MSIFKGKTLLITGGTGSFGNMVLKRLLPIDKVAYVRFASVYRDFKDVEEFSQELRSLTNDQ